jgi:bifunctional UDP-N-acetylglucosamine pyrophosphorylase/glucosamine-1-phosphate N-acetyltransferase
MKKAPIFALILAAGQGTRMRSATPKVLHEVGGRSLIRHVLEKAEQLEADEILAVLPPDQEEVAALISPHSFVIQASPQGTADAAKAALAALQRFASRHPEGDVFILFGDTPLLTRETLQAMYDLRHGDARTGGLPTLVLLGMRLLDGGGYGRILCDGRGNVKRIVEAKDATPAELEETLCNSGVMLVRAAALPALLAEVNNQNRSGEYYLTDIVQIARSKGQDAWVVEGSPDEVLGVNSRADLAVAERVFQDRKRSEMLQAGVTLRAPETVFFSYDTEIESDVTIEPHVVFGPGVRIHRGAEIQAFSHIEGAIIQSGARVGPFARLRKGANIGMGARIGNFVEVKQSHIEEGAKINHLSYIGDAHVGVKANIGAGVITCNYDGFKKSPTYVGPGSFIGSNTALVAPLAIGEGAIVGAGSVITEDVPAEALAFTRPPVTLKEGGATRFRTKNLKAGRNLKNATPDDIPL